MSVSSTLSTSNFGHGTSNAIASFNVSNPSNASISSREESRSLSRNSGYESSLNSVSALEGSSRSQTSESRIDSIRDSQLSSNNSNASDAPSLNDHAIALTPAVNADANAGNNVNPQHHGIIVEITPPILVEQMSELEIINADLVNAGLIELDLQDADEGNECSRGWLIVPIVASIYMAVILFSYIGTHK